MLKFTVKGQSLIRLDCNKLIQYAQDYPEAVFTFDEDWSGLTRTVQWSMGEVAYDTPVADDGKVIVPWEVLRDKGVLNVNAVGVADNKIITTNTVSINVMGCGVVGGMVSGKPSGTFYSELDGRVSKIELDRETTFAVQELVTEIIRQAGGISIRTTEDEDNPDNAALVDINPETGIRILNNLPKDSDWYIKIGQGNEKGDVDYGIMYRSDNGEFWVMHNGQAFICLTPNSSGALNFIKGNETLKIISKNGMLSFASDDAGIDYHKATWTERLKQLDVFTDKGINMEGKNNSYWWVNAEKKAVYGNTLNKLEFRTDGVAKFSNTVNAPDYQIGGNSVKEQLNVISGNIKDIYSYTAKAKEIRLDLIMKKLTNIGCLTSNYDEVIYTTQLDTRGDHDEQYECGTSLRLNPNVVYYITTTSLNGVDGHEMYYNDEFTVNLNSHNISDVFQLINIRDPCWSFNKFYKTGIVLPQGITWDETSADSGDVLTITDGKARLDTYGDLSLTTAYPNGIYAAVPHFYYELEGTFITDPEDANRSINQIINSHGEVLAEAYCNNTGERGLLLYKTNKPLRYSIDFSKISVVLDDGALAGLGTFENDDFIELRNVRVDVINNQTPLLKLNDVQFFAPSRSGYYNFTIFHKKISWERVGEIGRYIINK